MPPEKIGIVPAHNKHEANDLSAKIAEHIQSAGRTVVAEDALQRGISADAVLALGGDGLMMRVAHAYPGVPILGVNFGTVGFLAMVERADWQKAVDHVLAGNFECQDGPTLGVRVRRDGGESYWSTAVNDVVIRSGVQMIDTELYIDQQYVNTYPGDGMIVATPQGSTAYCMAAGGPILVAGVRGFALTPLSPHSPIRATLVVPEESVIELVIARKREAQLILDGVVVADLGYGDRVEIRKGEHPFRMIVTPGMSFYEAFRTKFNYLIRPDARPSLGVDRR